MDQSSAIEALAALSHPTRLDVFRLLVRHAPEGVPSLRIADTLGAKPSTLSGHLNVLKRSGLVSSKRNQREIIYTVDLGTVSDLMLFVVAECCDGNVASCEKTFRLFGAAVPAS